MLSSAWGIENGLSERHVLLWTYEVLKDASNSFGSRLTSTIVATQA